jgi:hypothetical protein
MRVRVLSTLVVAGLLAASVPAHALSILGIYSDTFAGPDNSTVNGGGNIENIFAAAADYWEQVILDDVTVTIPFGWVPGSSGLGAFNGIDISFPSEQPWFLDPTPFVHEEYTSATSVTASLDGTPINYGVGFTGGFGTAQGYDLLTVMLHEIGHALTFSSGTAGPFLDYQDGFVDVTSPRPLAGLRIPVPTGCCHVGTPASYTGLQPLLFPTLGQGERRLIADVDLLFVAEGGQFEQLDPSRFQAPEPGTLALFAIAAVGLARRRGRRQR